MKREEFSSSDVSGWLASSLGTEKARDVVAVARSSDESSGERMTRDQVEALLSQLAEEPGLVGMAALLAKSRLHFLSAATRLRS